MKKYAPLVILVAIIATVALAARYEELLVGALKCDSIAGQPGKAAPTATLGATTATSFESAGSLAMSGGAFSVISTQLVFIAEGVTNVIDADITSP